MTPPNDTQSKAAGDAPAARGEVQHVDLPPVRRERTVEIPRPIVEEQVVEVPHVHYVERIEEVPSRKIVDKTVPVPAVEVTERIIEIPKPVREQRIVEVPQIQIADRVVEVPHYIIQERVVEKPKIMLQERIIPLPRRRVEEKIVEIPEAAFNCIIEQRCQAQGLDPRVHLHEKGPAVDKDDFPQPPDVSMLPREVRREFHHSVDGSIPEQLVDQVVEVPHVQHIMRNVMKPVTRHVPKPVNVPITHYEPVPVERIVDRNVPIPVELEIVQEFYCPQIRPKYTDVPVPIPVERTVELPVPGDAMFNNAIMDAYVNGAENAGSPAARIARFCQPPVEPVPLSKMTETDLRKAGIDTQPTMSNVRRFQSCGRNTNAALNVAQSGDFFGRAHTLAGRH